MRRRARERQEKREDGPILKRLRATLLRSFSWLYGEKMVCVRGVPGVTGTLGKKRLTANSYLNPTQLGLGPRHHVETAADWCSLILLALHLYTIYTTEISRCRYPKKSESSMCFGNGQKVRSNG